VALALAILLAGVRFARGRLQLQEMKGLAVEAGADTPVEMPEVSPRDIHNENLLANVRPTDWVNPEPAPRYNLVVIGGGTAGLVTAAGAAGLGAKVALVERHLLGGDCLNYGCVPSKAIIRSSRVYAEVRDAGRFGVRVPEGVEVDFAAVMERMRRLRAGISGHDAARRFRDLGVDVFLGQASFTGPDTVAVGDKILRFAKGVIATGGRAVHPEVPGLQEAGFLTNETVFSLTARPRRLLVMGGGPIGCEFAQAMQRLGCRVTLLHKYDRLLNKEDADVAELIQRALQRDGLELLFNARPLLVSRTAGGKAVRFESRGETGEIEVDEILIGAGRAPNVEGLNLEAARVRYEAGKGRGVLVNDRLQTSNSRIYAAGDVCLPYQFTHLADAAARIVIQNALFFGRKKLSALTIPWCTYTDPEVAHVGLNEAAAAQQGIKLRTFIRPWSEVDRAIIDGEEEGFVKVHVKAGGDEIVGATIVARHAGEMIGEVAAAMAGRLGLGALAAVIHPYPTQAEAIRQAGDLYNRTRLTPWLKKMFSRFLSWRR
jgi:pyruvate/2-oxoglutarate dehydrogenase complex dihydrolipoamide dehydrogenase (E3) component